MFNFKYPQYNGLYCVVKYKGQWMEYNQAEKEKKAVKTEYTGNNNKDSNNCK